MADDRWQMAPVFACPLLGEHHAVVRRRARWDGRLCSTRPFIFAGSRGPHRGGDDRQGERTAGPWGRLDRLKIRGRRFVR